MRAPDVSASGKNSRFTRLLIGTVLGLILSAAAPGRAAPLVRDDEFLLRNWDTEDGLPSSTASHMARDREGYLWLATWRGLARFDGNHWEVFNRRTTPALKNDTLGNIWTDRSGRLLISASSGGLIRFETNVFTQVLPPAATGNAEVRNLAEDGSGALWLATKAGLLCLREKKLTRYTTTNGLPADSVSTVFLDRAQQVWAVAAQKLLTLRNDTWQTVPVPPGMSVIGAAPGRAGGVWIVAWNRTQECLFQWSESAPGKVSEIIPWPSGALASDFTYVAEDRSGRVFCANPHAVLVRHPDGRWHPLLPNPALGTINITSLYLDQDDTVWIGSVRNGLFQARPRLAQTLPLPAGVPSQLEVLAVAVARDGSVWGGTDLGGICRWSNGVTKWYGKNSGLGSLTVNALLEDRQTNLWAGTAGGLCRWDGSRFQPVPGAAPMQGDIHALLEDSHGDLWVGSESGLVRRHNGTAEVCSPLGLHISGLAEDPAGRIWAGTIGGKLLVKAPGMPAFRQIFFTSPVPVHICGIHAAPDGAIWILTYGQGLFCWRNGQVQRWAWSLGGLPSDHLFAAVEDRDGNLWMSCERGIFGIMRETLRQLAEGTNGPLISWRLQTGDGLAQKVGSGQGQPAATRSADGRLWFPNGVAVAVFNPAEVTTRYVPPTPVIENILVNGQGLTNGWHRFQIPSGTRTVTFRYTAPDPISAERQKYRTRLDGLDDDWVEAGDNREVSYNRLRPGDYAFHAMVTYPDGSRAASPDAISFKVIPRLYERLSVRVAAAILILCATTAAAWRWERARYAHRLARMQFQQEMERERARIARDIHDELGSGLTEIILLSGLLPQDQPGTQENHKIAQEINQRAQILTQEMDEVVWAVNARNDTIEGLLNYLNDFAQRHLNLAGMDCHLDIPPDISNHPISAEVRHNLFLAAKEAINNVTRHSRATEATIRAAFLPPRFTLTIEDNGRGMEAANARPHGNGLRNMQQRMAEIGGECLIEPLPAGGSRIRFTLQLKPIRPG